MGITDLLVLMLDVMEGSTMEVYLEFHLIPELYLIAF